MKGSLLFFLLLLFHWLFFFFLYLLLLFQKPALEILPKKTAWLTQIR